MGHITGSSRRCSCRTVCCCIDAAICVVANCRGVNTAVGVAVSIRSTVGAHVVNGNISLPSIGSKHFDLERRLALSEYSD